MSATVADQLSVVPTVMSSGDAFNVVRAASELMLDLRARSLAMFEPVLATMEPASAHPVCGRAGGGGASDSTSRPASEHGAAPSASSGSAWGQATDSAHLFASPGYGEEDG